VYSIKRQTFPIMVCKIVCIHGTGSQDEYFFDGFQNYFQDPMRLFSDNFQNHRRLSESQANLPDRGLREGFSEVVSDTST